MDVPTPFLPPRGPPKPPLWPRPLTHPHCWGDQGQEGPHSPLGGEEGGPREEGEGEEGGNWSRLQGEVGVEGEEGEGVGVEQAWVRVQDTPPWSHCWRGGVAEPQYHLHRTQQCQDGEFINPTSQHAQLG